MDSGIIKTVEELAKQLSELAKTMCDAHAEFNQRFIEHSARFEELIASHIEPMNDQLEGLTAKVEARNKSAPVKRNMTDADALNVLNGDLKDVDHKTAAIKIGLTYAQVYSCRGGFTFKHVLHELEKAGWKNQWDKPKSQKR